MTLEEIRPVIVKALQVDESEVVETASLQEDLGADSLDLVELVMAFEDEFDVDIPDDVAADIKTVGDAVIALSKVKE